MSIEPDTKDWTWVLERPCPECGFDATAIAVTELAAQAPPRARDLGVPFDIRRKS